MEIRHQQRLGVLDGMRGIAIFIVVWYHLWLMTWQSSHAGFSFLGRDYTLDVIPVTGFLGVELFFFISGFCLFYPYARTMLEGRPRQTLRDYVYRRAIKIVPSYVFLLVVLAPIMFRANQTPAGDAMKILLAHAAFIMNWFPGMTGQIAGVLWSLGVEVQFYLVFPLFTVLFMWRPWVGFAVTAAIGLGYRLAVIHAASNDQMWFFLDQLPGVIDLFGGGMLAAYLFVLGRNARQWQRHRVTATVISIVGWCALFALVTDLYTNRFGPNSILIWQAHYRLVFSIVLIAVTVASLFSAAWWRAIIANPLLLFLSTISYNLYLWHQAIIVGLYQNHVPPWPADPHANGPWQWTFTLIALPAALAVPIVVTYVLERPILRRGPGILVETFVAAWRALGVSVRRRGEPETIE